MNARTSFLISMAAAALAVAAGFIFGGRAVGGLALIPVVVLWAAAHFRRWIPGNALSFAALTLLVMAGLWMELPPMLLILGEGFAIAAWDLTHFHEFTTPVGNQDQVGKFFRSHVRVLFPILAAGMAGSWMALNLELQLGFLPVLVLGFILIISLRQLLRRELD